MKGGRCPIWGHIRKVNPRDLGTDKGGPDETRSFQMLRRGIPFGPLYDRADPSNASNGADRGLLFLAYQKSITDQFETLNSNWMNSISAPSDGGFDLLVGQHRTETGATGSKLASYFDPTTGRTDQVVALNQWVTPTGGAYLFTPSISWTRIASS